MALAAGAIGSLLPKLNQLYMGMAEAHILPRRVGWEIMRLIQELEMMESSLRSVSEADLLDEQVKLWTEDASNLSYHIDGVIGKFATSGPQPGPSGDIITRIKSKLKTAKARRKFVADIRNVKRLLHELHDRRARYRMEPTIFPFRPPPASDGDGSGDDDGETGMEMAMGAELAALLADADHVYRLPSRVKDDIAFLKAEMQTVTVVLRKIAEMPVAERDEVTEAWADDLRDASRDIKSAVDTFQALRWPRIQIQRALLPLTATGTP